MSAVTLPSRIGVLGDVHGSLRVMERAFVAARKAGLDTIVQVGDFWIYDNPREVAKLTRRAKVHGISSILFLDGNHENYSYLDGKHSHPGAFTIPGSDGVVRYLGRGTPVAFGGTGSLGGVILGGAVSADRFLTGRDSAGRRIKPRVEGKDWFPEEAITDADVGRAISAGGTVLFSHDAPHDVMELHDLTRGDDIHPQSLVDDAASRSRLTTVWNSLGESGRVIFHGHFNVTAVTRSEDLLVSVGDGALVEFDSTDLFTNVLLY